MEATHSYFLWVSDSWGRWYKGVQTTYSLNLEYLFLLLYNAATGVHYTQLPAFLSSLVGLLQGLGIFLSLVFLVGLVYFHLRHEQLHHEHEHEMHGKAHAHGHKGDDADYDESPAGAARWEHVMTLMTEAHPSSWRGAIVEADILLSELLRDLRLPGSTIGEQLKATSRSQFTTLDLAWEAHKVRNEIAHAGSAYSLSGREADRAIDLYRQGFEEFEYI